MEIDYAQSCVIAVCTYKRPHSLSKAIEAVSNLIFPNDLKIQFLVVDNDPSSSSKIVFDEGVRSLKIEAKYIEEYKRGIVHARNAALTYALNINADFLAFFDDDDHPDSNWIQSLWKCQKKHKATVSAGKMVYKWPVHTNLDEDTKRIYDSILGDVKSGKIRSKCGAGNVIMDLQFVRLHNLSFNERLNFTGGEDSHFFRQLSILGGKIIWCNEAVIFSNVDKKRCSAEFIFRRRYRVGYNSFIIDSLIYGRWKAVLKTAFFCLDRWVSICFEVIKKKNNKARLRRFNSEIRGRIHAMLGVKFKNYLETDGN
ncbi:Glycosyltransferase, GT2 family [Ekhidna lutea]|uniref:Glycosyltransferase, GT2 family n=1 Tax=Ekhidna lutea TaxID=447679 RepID=A0A239FQU7_EKHLU|nr:glycosyltransferase family A protein [Ekhidna lutea]SNS59271.1 Glycosyltransferase, GT2 family [Ekhidna lutea]